MTQVTVIRGDHFRAEEFVCRFAANSHLTWKQVKPLGERTVVRGQGELPSPCTGQHYKNWSCMDDENSIVCVRNSEAHEFLLSACSNSKFLLCLPFSNILDPKYISCDTLCLIVCSLKISQVSTIQHHTIMLIHIWKHVTDSSIISFKNNLSKALDSSLICTFLGIN